MSTENHWPGVWLAPVLQRVLPLPSTARDAGSPGFVVEAVATQPDLGSTVWARATPAPATNHASIATPTAKSFVIVPLPARDRRSWPITRARGKRDPTRR